LSCAETIFVAVALESDVRLPAMEDLDRHEGPFSRGEAVKASAKILGEFPRPTVSLRQLFL
jgi:hypothetical protein